MDSSIKELIELSTKSGDINFEARNLIYKKAEEKGISKTECDIYIDGYINQIKKEDKVVNSGNKRWGYWLIICGVIDLIWLIANADILKYDDGRVTVIWLLSIFAFIFFGLYLLGFKGFKKIFIPVLWIIGIIITGVIIGQSVLFSNPLGAWFYHKFDLYRYETGGIGFFIISVPLFIFFRKKCFGEKYGNKIGIGISIVMLGIFILMMFS